MCREIEETYDDCDDQAQVDSIIDILSDGIFNYLKSNGLLKLDSKRTDRINRIMKDARSLSVSNSEENGE